MSLISNRKAYHEYEILEEFEAGMKLLGTEVKSLKEGHGNLTGSYIMNKKGTFWLIGFNLPMYSKSGILPHYNPTRNRKILLHKEQIKSLTGKVERQGYTLVPLKIYQKGSILKLSVGLARGKKKGDKKQDQIKKQLQREVEKELKTKTN